MISNKVRCIPLKLWKRQPNLHSQMLNKFTICRNHVIGTSIIIMYTNDEANHDFEFHNLTLEVLIKTAADDSSVSVCLS